MAWVRTATSLIAFGFTIFQFFERFVSGKAGGLGMGLPISRSIVQAHGGRIWAASNAERGLIVHIELPCEEKAARA